MIELSRACVRKVAVEENDQLNIEDGKMRKLKYGKSERRTMGASSM